MGSGSVKDFQKLDEFRVPDGFRGRSKFVVQMWWIVYSFMFAPSPQIMYGWRRMLLRCFGAKIGKKVIIRPSVRVTYPWKVEIGDYSWIGDDVVLYSLGRISIGSNSVVSQRSYLCTGGHDYTRREFDIFSKQILIGHGCWIAADVFLAPGIEIGDRTVVGARSSVFKSLPEGVVAHGSPAKVVGMREMRKSEKTS